MAKSNICSCENCRVGWFNFETLNPDELKYANENRFEAVFKSGETIIKQGSPASNVVFLAEGMAKVYIEGAGEKNLIISISKPGTMIIGPGLYTDLRHTFSVSALGHTRVCFINSDVIRHFVKTNNKFAEGLVADIRDKAQKNIYKLMSMTQKKMPGRVAEILLYLADNVFESDTFTMILTRQELADMSAMAKESVVRILKEFSDEKIIDTSKQKFKIINRQKLDMICTNG